MTLPAIAPRSLPEEFEALEREADDAIAVCDGDVRAALRATLIADALSADNQRLTASLSTGFDRQRIRKMRRPVKISLS